MAEENDDFRQMWAWFATHCHGYSPLYERISLAVAGDGPLLEWVQRAPPEAHLPPALLAAVHSLVLEGSEPDLAAVYAGRSADDPGPLFLNVCHRREAALWEVLSTRHIQTNECGRSAVVGPAMTWLAPRLGGPLALVDVGASAGINLLCDRFRIDYGSFGTTGPDDSPVRIPCAVTGGSPPIAARLPDFVTRVGIDRSPINLADAEDARWLLACVWPDTDRLPRTRAAIRLAQQYLPKVLAGDANAQLPATLAGLPDGAAAVVLTTWVFAYFPVEARAQFVDVLTEASHRRPVAWVSAESAGVVDGLAYGEDLEANDLLGAAIFDGGPPTFHLLGGVQEHGSWLDWRAEPG